MQRRDAPDESASEAREDMASIEALPPLARMAAIAALVDLIWNRVVVRIAWSRDQELAVGLLRWGVFPRNLAAVAGIIALAAALFTFMRMAGYSGLGRRLGVASVSGIVVPAFVIAIVKPKEEVLLLVVVAALVGSNLLAVLVGTVALGYAAGARRWASAIVTMSGAFVLTVLVVASIRTIAESALATPLGILAHHGGEVAWHLVPVLVLVAMARAQKGAPPSEGPPPRLPVWGTSVAIVVFGVTAAALYGETVLHSHGFATLVYAAFRVTLIPAPLAWLNGLTLGIGLAAAGYGLASRHPGRAQLGAAVALWLAAGCAPRAPGQLLDFALAAVLLARAAQAITPEGRARARTRWAPLVEPAAADANPP